jgi:GNAT superfamily N-acetyltransferase
MACDSGVSENGKATLAELWQGKVPIADVAGEVAGYATILTRVKSEQLEDGKFEYGLVSDLVVMDQHRNSGLGTKLLDEADAYAKACKVRWLKIGVLAANKKAERLYLLKGFAGQYFEPEKDLTRL